MVCSTTSEGGKTFGERKRVDDQGKQSLVSEASKAARTTSSSDRYGPTPLAQDHTRLACPKTQAPGSLFARNVGNSQLILV